jgi:hypothetical protein
MLLSDCVDGSLQFAVTPGGGGNTPQCAPAADGIFPGILAKEQKLRRFSKSYGDVVTSYLGLVTDGNCLLTERRGLSPMPSSRARPCRDAYERKADRISWVGTAPPMWHIEDQLLGPSPRACVIGQVPFVSLVSLCAGSYHHPRRGGSHSPDAGMFSADQVLSQTCAAVYWESCAGVVCRCGKI